MNKILLASTIALLVTGCASYDLTGKTPQEYVSDKTGTAVDEFLTKPPTSAVREIEQPYLDFSEVPKRHRQEI
jgi:hypothetical protein